jgi:hypothetical protein
MRTSLALTLLTVLVSSATAIAQSHVPAPPATNLRADARFRSMTLLDAGVPIYGLAAGELDGNHPGPELACLLADGRVVMLTGTGTSWTARTIFSQGETILDMAERPTIEIGDVHSAYAGNEIVIDSVFRSTVLFNTGSSWGSQHSADMSDFIGNTWGSRVGDLQPARPGDEIFFLYEGILDFSTASLLAEVGGSYTDVGSMIVYAAEVGMDSAIGDLDASHPGNEVVVTTEMGPTYLLFPTSGSTPWPRVTLWDDFDDAGWDVEISDVLPSVPGNEIVYGTRYSNAILLSTNNGDGTWRTTKLFTGNLGTGNMWDVAIADIWPASPTKEIMGVDDSGAVYVVSRTGQRWRGVEIWRDSAALTSVLGLDVLPAVQGDEILVAGESGRVTLLY